jgi:hypothetical protein
VILVHAGIPEVVPGVFIEPGSAVYIVDEIGEVVSWNEDEFDDPFAVTAALNAVALAASKGAGAVRQNLLDHGISLDALLCETQARRLTPTNP